MRVVSFVINDVAEESILQRRDVLEELICSVVESLEGGAHSHVEVLVRYYLPRRIMSAHEIDCCASEVARFGRRIEWKGEHHEGVIDCDRGFVLFTR